MQMPPLLASRSPTLQVVLGDVVPFTFGAVCGVLLGVSAPAYVVLSVLGVAGGYGAGLEHRTAGEGAGRGVVGGFLFGVGILIAHSITGAEETVRLPEPPILLAILTTAIGCGLGALGGRTRSRARQAPPPVLGEPADESAAA